jgi:hypothetical protein
MRVSPTASSDASVGHIDFIDDLERIRRCRPDTLVVLQRRLAQSAWAVSVALRYAWERRVTCLITQLDQASEPIATRLAERLGVPMGNYEAADLADLALALAAEVGDPDLANTRRVAALATELADGQTPADILDTLRQHLPGVRVELVTDIGHGSRHSEPEGDVLELPLGPDQLYGRWLRAVLPPGGGADGDWVRQALTLARAPLIACEATGGLARLRDHQVENWLLDSVLDAAGTTGSSSAVLLADCRPEWFTGDGTVVAVVLCGDAGLTVTDSVDLVLAERMRLAEPIVGPVRYQQGWAFWLSYGDDQELDDDTRREELKAREQLRDALQDAMSQLNIGLPLVAALGPTARSRGELGRSLRLAALGAEAARLGRSDRIRSLESFSSEASLVAMTSLPQSQEIAAEVLAPLRGMEDAEQLLETLVTFLDTGGSTTRSAELLKCHRNTVTARLDRIRQAGIDLDRPENRLCIHIAAYVQLRVSRGTVAAQDEPPDLD